MPASARARGAQREAECESDRRSAVRGAEPHRRRRAPRAIGARTASNRSVRRTPRARARATSALPRGDSRLSRCLRGCERAIARLDFRSALPDLGVELSSNLGLAAELADGGRELRKVLVGAQRSVRLIDPVETRIALVRTEEWAPVQLPIVVVDVIEQRRAQPHARPGSRPRRGPRMDRRSGRTRPSSPLSDPRPRTLPVATARVARSYRAARSIRADAGDAHEASAFRHRLAHAQQLRRLLPMCVAVPTAPPCSDCPRAIRPLRPTRACCCTTCCEDPRAGLVPRRRARCRRTRRARLRHAGVPRDGRARCEPLPVARAVETAAHEVDVARFHRFPLPMFMVTARMDAVWVHDGFLDARLQDRPEVHRADRRHPLGPRAGLRAGGASAPRGLRLRLRYEHLQPEVDEDPEPWEPDDEELAAVEEEPRAAVERMWYETNGAASRARRVP